MVSAIKCVRLMNHRPVPFETNNTLYVNLKKIPLLFMHFFLTLSRCLYVFSFISWSSFKFVILQSFSIIRRSPHQFLELCLILFLVSYLPYSLRSVYTSMKEQTYFSFLQTSFGK